VSSRIAVSSHDESPQAGRRGRSAASLVIPALTWVWLVGGTLLMGYILLRAFRLWRAVTKERPVTDQGILEALEDGKMRMRVRTLVGVVVTDMVRTPALFGFIRPRILLPQGLIETLGPDGLHHVFLHELAHLKRRDIHLAWLVCLLQVLHWFNPLIWFAFRRMRTDQEMAADALALAAAGAGESRRYGQTIVSLLERFSCPQYLPSLAGILENPSHIERRIQMIARFNTTRRRPLLAVVPLAVLTLIALTDAQDKPKSEKPQSVTPPAASAAPAEKVSVADVNGTLVDPNTGLKFTVAKRISGENDVIIHNNTVSLSPNGKFLRWRGTAIPLDGGRPISLGGGGRDVAWSPDGKLIAYRSGWEIWLLPVSPETCQATGPARKLADDEANWSVGRISWSADSECLMLYYFEEGKRRPTEKCLSARDGKLIQTPDYTRFGLVSPDQKRLAYFKGRGVWTASP